MRAWWIGLVLLVVLPAASRASPGPPALLEVVVVSTNQSETDAGWSDAAREARLGDRVELAVVGLARENGRTVYLVDGSVDALTVRGKRVRERDRRPWGDVETRWLQVEPYAWRQGDVPAANGTDTRYYTNVVSGGPEHGTWLGYDRITYSETEVAPAARGPSSRLRRIRAIEPTRAEDDV
jgi:hypothetical protein